MPTIRESLGGEDDHGARQRRQERISSWKRQTAGHTGNCVCPDCEYQHTPFPQVVASVMGRPTAGKSEWVAAAIYLCQNQRLPKQVGFWTRPSPRWEDRIALYENRVRSPSDHADKTFLTPMTFHGSRTGILFCLFKHRFAVTVCDSSGEEFKSKFGSQIRDTLLMKSAHVLVVDPTQESEDGDASFISRPTADVQAYIGQLEDHLTDKTIGTPSRLCFVMTKLDQIIRAATGTHLESKANTFASRLREIDQENQFDVFSRNGRTFSLSQAMLRAKSDATIDFLEAVWPAWNIRALQERLRDRCGVNAGWWFPTTTVSFDEGDLGRSYSEVVDPRPYGVVEPLAYLAWTAGHINIPE